MTQARWTRGFVRAVIAITATVTLMGCSSSGDAATAQQPQGQPPASAANQPPVAADTGPGGAASHGDTQHGDLQHGDLQHGDLQHGDLQHGDMQHGDVHHENESTGQDTAGHAHGEAMGKPAKNDRPVIDHYEHIRAMLADDQADVAGPARALQRVAEQSGKTAAGKGKAAFAALATAAGKLAATSGKDIQTVRVAFGEVSKALLALLAAEPKLAEGLHAFSCPMARAYRKWVQVTKDLANPYMGKKMLSCGQATDMRP